MKTFITKFVSFFTIGLCIGTFSAHADLPVQVQSGTRLNQKPAAQNPKTPGIALPPNVGIQPVQGATPMPAVTQVPGAINPSTQQSRPLPAGTLNRLDPQGLAVPAPPR